MTDPNPTVWLPAEDAPDLAPPPPEILVPGAELESLVGTSSEDPAGAEGVADGPAIDQDATATADDVPGVGDEPPVTDQSFSATGVPAPAVDQDRSGPSFEEEISPEILAALPIELLGIAPRTVLSPDSFLAWGLGLGAGAIVLSLIPPFWWMFGLVLGATAARVAWTAWIRSTGLYADRRTRALVALVVAGLGLGIGAIAGVKFFATMSQITVG